ncbi:hypothetical protein SO802_029291 [Lithocarpus litseifolius]|uniref:Reverse transcriptase zinc-binding domain-containing protein n=1 Tax=Lithocarpus litseifolius TaxID=425828 RepID=A0AAW2BT99_9ROSI
MHRHILQENICGACGLEVEDSRHLFWHCPKAKEVWEASGLVKSLELGRIGSFMDLLWLLKISLKLEVELLALVAVLAWCLWSSRNQVNVDVVVFSSLKPVGVGIAVRDQWDNVAAAKLDLPSFIRTTNEDDIMLKFFICESERTPRVSAIILNTFDPFEQDVLDALSSMLPRIYTIGPLMLPDDQIKDDNLKSIGLIYGKKN